MIESVFLHSPDKRFWVCLGDLPPDMPRYTKHSSAILGSETPKVTIHVAEGNSIHLTRESQLLPVV